MHQLLQPELKRRTGIVAGVVTLLMLAALWLPLLLGIAATKAPPPVREALESVALIGEPAVPRPAFPTLRELRLGEFQTAFAAWFSRILYPRSLVVRLTNQLQYDLFARSEMYNGGIVVGQNAELYEKTYIEAHCHSVAAGLPAFDNMIVKIRDVQDKLRKLGKPFIFVTSPSKPVSLPQNLPPGACGSNASTGSQLAGFVDRLRQAGVAVVDGAAMTREMNRTDPLPAFPQGGTHWSDLVSMRVSREMLQALNASTGTNLGSYEIGTPNWASPAKGSDVDLAMLLNLYRPPISFATGSASTTCEPSDIGRRTSLLVIGGSFAGGLIQPIDDCKLFAKIDYYFYYNLSLVKYPGAVTGPVDRAKIDWAGLLAGPVAIVAELNEHYLSGGAPLPWLTPFLDDVLAAP